MFLGLFKCYVMKRLVVEMGKNPSLKSFAHTVDRRIDKFNRKMILKRIYTGRKDRLLPLFIGRNNFKKIYIAYLRVF